MILQHLWNQDNLSEYFRTASAFPDLPETPPPPLRTRGSSRTVATQTDVTVASAAVVRTLPRVARAARVAMQLDYFGPKIAPISA